MLMSVLSTLAWLFGLFLILLIMLVSTLTWRFRFFRATLVVFAFPLIRATAGLIWAFFVITFFPDLIFVNSWDHLPNERGVAVGRSLQLSVILLVLQLKMLIQWPFWSSYTIGKARRYYLPVWLRTVLNGAMVVPGNLRRRPPVSLPLLFGNIKRHPQCLLMRSLVRLQQKES